MAPACGLESGEMVPRILKVTPLAGYTLEIEWEGGETTAVSLASLIGSRRAFRPLADPAVFRKAKVVDFGRAVRWPSGADVWADLLWLETN